MKEAASLAMGGRTSEPAERTSPAQIFLSLIFLSFKVPRGPERGKDRKMKDRKMWRLRERIKICRPARCAGRARHYCCISNDGIALRREAIVPGTIRWQLVT